MVLQIGHGIGPRKKKRVSWGLVAQLQFVLKLLRPEGRLMLDRAEALEAYLVAHMDETTDERRDMADGFMHIWSAFVPFLQCQDVTTETDATQEALSTFAGENKRCSRT